jgi:hypothetical protein
VDLRELAETADGGPQALTCFVIGPIGNRHAPVGSEERLVYEDALQVLEEVVEPACAAVGLDPVRADGLTRAGEITEQVFRRLHNDDVVIADLTGANANVMYELGLRHTRAKLTIQIGEYGRLPFDVNVVRTVMFSRSRHGLVQARNELIELLQAGIAGEFDPVAATRVWSEAGGGTVKEIAEPSLTTGQKDEEIEDEAPGFLDLVAGAEAHQEEFLRHAEGIAESIQEMGALAEQSVARVAQSDAQGKGMRGRLALAVEYANGLSQIADVLENQIDQYVTSLEAISGGNLAIIEGLEDDPSQLADAMEYALTTRRLAQTARESMASLSGMVETMEDNAKLSKVLREPTRRITKALGRQADATAVIDEWDRRLQALGVPMPPEDWEPDTEGIPAGVEENLDSTT